MYLRRHVTLYIMRLIGLIKPHTGSRGVSSEQGARAGVRAIAYRAATGQRDRLRRESYGLL